MSKEPQIGKKVIILGFDGLDTKIVEKLMKEDRLPNLKKLKEKGTYSPLKTTNPSQSPVAWAGFATGKNPGKNGVCDFIVRDPKNYGLSISMSNMKGGKPRHIIKADTVWHYATKKNVPSTVITCPVTFPPEKIQGKMLSGMGVPDILGTQGTFSFYTTEYGSPVDVGGKVFNIGRGSMVVSYFIGPRVSKLSGETENCKVPFKLQKLEDGKVKVTWQEKEVVLEKEKWSDFHDITFKLNFFKKAKGIFKFYLVSTEPELKLYVSPINFDPRDPLFDVSYPSDYAEELAEKIGLYYTLGMPMDTWAVNEKRLSEKPFIELAETVLHEKRTMLQEELNSFKGGILFCYFESADIMQHMFWRYTDPRHPIYEDDDRYKGIIHRWYEEMDKNLGMVIDKVSDDDLLIVLSDHGFGTFRRSVHVNTWLRKEGYLVLKNPDAPEGEELLKSIDWSKTKAYSIGYGGIYVNQAGREKQGIVKEGAESDSLKKEIAEKILSWQDPKYNGPVVRNVYKGEDIFRGQFLNEMPDLYLGLQEGYRASWQTALGAVPKDLLEDNTKKWSGSHLFDPELIPGVLFINRKVTKDAPSILDITPTVLKEIGYSKEEIDKQLFDGETLY